MLLLLFAVSAASQTVDQKTQGTCSPAVVTNGNVVITCNTAGNNPSDLRKIQKGVDILNAILTQKDSQILSKLDAVLALLTPISDEVILQRKELTAIQQYSEVSKLGMAGRVQSILSDVRDQTPVSRALEGALTLYVKDGQEHAKVLCDASAIQKFRDVIKSYPKFPFSYYSLSYCLEQKGDPLWREYALKAQEILKITTTIDGHNGYHDSILHELTQALQH
jgi:hypothetical protein